MTGRVIEVLARDNQPVEAGAVLFKLDPEPYQIAVDGYGGVPGNVQLSVQLGPPVPPPPAPAWTSVDEATRFEPE